MKLTTAAKVLITIVAVLFAAVLALGVGGWIWWKRNAGDLLEAGKEAIVLGRESGATMEESGCVARALEMHKADPDLSILSSVRNGLWLTGCLETSRVERDFCAHVPSQDETIARGLWAGSACARQGLSDPYCPTLLQNVAKYCSSPARSEKSLTHASNRAG